ncbi:MAG: cysteine-rich CWC family protein [Bacteroidetes bacterium]|nr:cysteine-rich CWC family protein [Fibrella sp.]
MTKHAPDSCPRCGQLFTCKVSSVGRCDCLRINLSFSETQYIRDITALAYDGGCLCLDCLHSLQLDYRTKYSNNES